MKQHIIQTIDTLEQSIAEMAEAIKNSRAQREQKIIENPDYIDTDEYTESLMATHELRKIMGELQEAHHTLFRYYQ